MPWHQTPVELPGLCSNFKAYVSAGKFITRAIHSVNLYHKRKPRSLSSRMAGARPTFLFIMAHAIGR